MAIPFRRTPIAAAVGAALITPLPAHAFPIIAIGNEFELAEDTGNTNQQTPDIAIANDGRFVAVWEDGGEIFAQRFAADGTKSGSEILVPDDGGGTRTLPAVAMDDDGDFAVVWEGYYGGPAYGYRGTEIAFQRFDSNGGTVGSPVRATLDPAGPPDFNQTVPDIALDSDGDIAIAWQGNFAAGDPNTISYRLFAATSGAVTGALLAPTSSAATQTDPAIARSGPGEFVVVWDNQTASTVEARQFGSGGSPLGSDFPVGSTGTSQGDPDVAMDDDGDFAIAWDEYDGLAPYFVNYRAFRADGSELIPQTRVASRGTDRGQAIAMLDTNETVIAWEDSDANLDGVFISSFDASGNQQSGPLDVNQTTVGNQDKPALAMDSDGDVVVGFESYVSSTDDDVLARRFAPNFITGKSGGPGSFGWIGLLALGLAAAGRRLFARRRKRSRNGVAGLLAGALALGGLAGVPDAGVAAEPQNAGRVESARGTVTASRDGESRRSLGAGDPLYVGDRVATGTGASATLVLADGTEVDLQARSVFRVAALEPARGGGGFGGLFMDLLRGGLRMISGQIAEDAPARYRLRTPVATIGVRGTEFQATVCRAGDDCPGDEAVAPSGRVPAARVLDLRGVIEVTGTNGATRALDAGDGVYEGDTVETRFDAWGVLEFDDGSRVSLQPGTRFRIDEWGYERAEPDEGNALLNLLRGGIRVLTGLIGDSDPDGYRVKTPVATIGVRGTGFDLTCVGTCLNPDAALGAIEGDGLFISTWDGTAVAELEGTVAEFAAGETGFMANSVLPPVRVPSLPPALQDPVAPRPDRVTGQVPDGAERLHARVEEGTITVQGATGAPVVVGAGAAAVVTAGGAAGSPAGAGAAGAESGETAAAATGAGVATLGTAVGALVAGQFDLAAPYAGAATGNFSAGSKSDFQSRIRDDHPSASVNSLDGSTLGGRVFGGVRLLEVLAFEVGYVNMGELESEIDPGGDSPAAVADDALDDHPILATGFDFSTLVRTPVGIGTWAFARAGVFAWESEITTTTASGQQFSKDVSGTDPLVGGGVEYRIGPGTHARAEWIHYELDPDPVDYVGAGVVWSF